MEKLMIEFDIFD